MHPAHVWCLQVEAEEDLRGQRLARSHREGGSIAVLNESLRQAEARLKEAQHEARLAHML